MAEISNTVQPLSDIGVRTVGFPKFIKWDISGDKVKYDLHSTSYRFLHHPPQIVPEQVLQQLPGITPVCQSLPQPGDILDALHLGGQLLAAVQVAAQA